MDNQETLAKQLTKWHEAIARQPEQARYYVQRGMIEFKLGQILASIADFDRAEQLEPALKPYLWQRGLSFYYADRFAEGADQFAADLAVNPNDAEESLWQYLCRSRLIGRQAAQDTLTQAHDWLVKDPRPVMRSIYQLYRNACPPEELMANAKGDREQFYAYLYLGLYYESGLEAERDLAQAQLCIDKAAANFQIEDYMWYLARVHKQLRQW
jgi:lipoprotein NlpI